MKLNLTKEEAYDIVNNYAKKHEMGENKLEDIDKCVTFHESYTHVSGFAWVVDVAGVSLAQNYVVSDKTKEVEQTVVEGRTYIIHNKSDRMKLNLTKEEALKIAELYQEKHGFVQNKIENVDDVVFYSSFYDVDGATSKIL